MMSAEQKKPTKRTWPWLAPFLVILLIAAVGAGYAYWRVSAGGGGAASSWSLASLWTAQATPDAASAYKTTTVRRSDLTITISGSGKVITSQSVDLAFPVAGTVAEVNVQAGDVVTQGQVLARLGDEDLLKQAVKDQQLAVMIAQRDLDTLLTGASSALAQAQAAQATAQQAYAEAQFNLRQKGVPRCDNSLTRTYYFALVDAQKSVDLWETRLNDPNTGYGHDYILEHLNPARRARDTAQANLTYCQGYTDKEVMSSQANLQLAQAKLEAASASYASLKANSGLNPVAVEITEATLANAQSQLSQAESNFAGITLVAPMNGTVTAVSGKVGDEAGTGAFITLADLEQPEVQVNIDETDLSNFAVGCAAVVTFDSLTGQSFEGTVSKVSPVMVTVNNASMAQGLVDLKKKQSADGKTLSIGLTASVEVTCKQAKNALVIPVTAIYEQADQPAYVYVLNAQGQPEKRAVQVGLRTITSAEITSGLAESEKIVTTEITN